MSAGILLGLLYLKPCQRKHAGSERQSGGLAELAEAALKHLHGASCTGRSQEQRLVLISALASPPMRVSREEGSTPFSSQSQHIVTWTGQLAQWPGIQGLHSTANEMRGSFLFNVLYLVQKMHVKSMLDFARIILKTKIISVGGSRQLC